MSGPANTQFAVAIHALTLLTSTRGVPLSSEKMASSVGSNPVYLRRVLGRLRQAGLVASKPGPSGGWEIAREPETITLGDAWRAIRDAAPLFGLHEVVPGCQVGAEVAATLGKVDDALTATVQAQLDQTTIDEVAQAVVQASIARPAVELQPQS